ncbi:MAG TPA: phenylalanine--tRNA ligase subunit beta, partial [Blastocatellia bacterium]|nr:phenylalanine--tRNA ligase subunit beta [Blastocatellia bacterium]
PNLPEAKGTAPASIVIAEADLCPRFSARAIRNVKIKSSPDKIAHRLGLLDQRPISNAVDATNYVLWEMGKPTHVFDMDLLEGGKIIVRKAEDGETLKTLDGIERKLTREDLVVADAEKPVGLAGVMGGYDTMITEKTRNVMIESAWWDPATVRRTSKRHGLHTDASHRFERGADYESTVISCDRVAELILQSGGGELLGDVIDVIAKPLDQAPIVLRISEVNRILGTLVKTSDILRILRKLGFEVMPEQDPSEFSVRIPSWRLDVEREIDLIEEIARLYGYNRFPNTLPIFSGAVQEKPDEKKDDKLRSTLLALGYNETVSLSFISHEDAETFSSSPVIELANPISEEASIMRTSMLPGMLNMLAHNLNRGIDNVRLFESGSVFVAQNGLATEPRQVCFAATGSAVLAGVHQAARPVSFFDLKGEIETVLEHFEHGLLSFDTETADYYHSGRSARVALDGVLVAQFGQLHPEIEAKRKLRQDIWIAELYLEPLYKHPLRRIQFEPVAKYPSMERDFSFLFANEVKFENIERAIAKLSLPELRNFLPAEIFRGGKLPPGKYSILLRAMFQSKERTLRDEEIAGWSAKIVQVLEALGGTLRAQ